MNKKIIYFVCVSFMIMVMLIGCASDSVMEFEDDSMNEEVTFRDIPEEELKVEASNNQQIFVDIGGEVKYPGVYSFSDEARVFEVIDAAGGLTPDAYVAAINQAEPVTDGQKIYIMNKQEWEANSSQNAIEDQTNADDGLIDINHASESELCALPGIGSTRAAAIISYREKNGDFANIEEIKNVSGIKAGTYEKICDYIKVQ